MMTFFSENPESDLWRELLQYTYEANIVRYLEKNKKDVEENTVNCIAGSFLQAYEYYKSAKDANIQIAPLLLYYGSTNLLYGMINLLSGSINTINNHGMNIFIPKTMNYIADTEIHFLNPQNGGVHVIARALGFKDDLTGFGEWRLSEFLDSVAEIHNEYKICYNIPSSNILMLNVFNTPDGKVEKIYFDEENKAYIKNLLLNVSGFKNSYLNIVESKDQSNRSFFILRHKINGKDICEVSYSGQPYLRAAHFKNSKIVTVPTILNMYISLFTLSSLCRYHPEKWSPFVLKDTTGEKLLIEKFLFYARRMLPNMVLNQIIDSTVQYTSQKYEPIDTIKFVGEHKVQEMIKREINLRIEKEMFKKCD